MDVEDVCVCSINFDKGKGDSLKNCGFSIGELSDYELEKELKFLFSLKDHIKVKLWKKSRDTVPLIKALEILSLFFCKSFLNENVYFVFSDVESSESERKSECDNNNSNSNRSSCLSTSSDHPMKRKSENMNSTSVDEYGSVFGSPLKLEPIADISLNETSSDCLSASTIISDRNCSRVIGLSIVEARKILSKFCQLKQTEQEDMTETVKTLAILCDCSGGNTTNQTTILIGAQKYTDGSSKKLASFKVTCSNKKHNLSFLEPLNVSSGSVCPMQCTYKLLEQKDKARKLNVEAHWGNCHGNSIISNLHTAQFSLRISAPFGYKDSPSYKHLTELKYVMMLFKGLEKGELPNVLSTKPYNAPEQLQNLIMRIKNGLEKNKSPMNGGSKGKKINLAASYSADISDDLWEIFAQCETYQDMVQCLKMVFNILKKNELPLFVQNDNETLLAKLVRQSSSGLTYFPPLTDLMPLKIVTELGLEHMKKIYTAILLQNDLIVSHDFDKFLKDSLKEDTSANVSTSIVEPDHQIKQSLVETVKRLHHCIDLVCLVDQQTENLQLKAVAGHILNYYRVNALDENYTFVIPLDSRSASQEVEKLTPCMVRREYKVGEHTRVECLVSDMPEELSVPTPQQQQLTSDISMNINDTSKECLKFTTEENVMILGNL